MCLDDIAAVGKYLNSLLSAPSTDRSPAHLRVEFEHLLLVWKVVHSNVVEQNICLKYICLKYICLKYICLKYICLKYVVFPVKLDLQSFVKSNEHVD